MAADSLTKGLGASRLSQIREELVCPGHDECGFLQHHLLCLVSTLVSNCLNVFLYDIQTAESCEVVYNVVDIHMSSLALQDRHGF